MMPDMKVIDLSDAQERVQDSLSSEAELQEYDLGEIVSVEQGDGIIAAEVTSAFGWPVEMDEDEAKDFVEENDFAKEVTDDGDIRMEPEEGDPVYVIALQDGGSVAATANDIDEGGSLEGEGEDVKDWEDVTKKGDEAELAEIYGRVDDPSNYTEFQNEKKRMIQERQAAELADYVESADNDVSLSAIENYSYEELVNIPGVDDPHVGFDSMPNGWTRKSVLQAWASLGGMWRTCYARMIREMGPNFAKRWCAALKDEVLRTEEWRGDF